MKEIPGYPGYLIDEVGNVYTSKSGTVKPMKKRVGRLGYENIALSVDGKYRYPLIHRLVLETHLGPGAGLDCNHKNGNRADNRLENLEWMTRKENERHARSVLGKKVYGEYHPGAKISAQDVEKIRASRAGGATYISLSKAFGIGISQVSRIVKGQCWGTVALQAP